MERRHIRCPQILADYPDFIFSICVDQLFLRHLRSIYGTGGKSPNAVRGFLGEKGRNSLLEYMIEYPGCNFPSPNHSIFLKRSEHNA